MSSVPPRRRWSTRRHAIAGPLLLAILAAAAASATPGPARADDPADRRPPPPSTAALKNARALFAQAEHDEDAGRWQDALDKLHLVAEVRRTAGVRYHVALCAEHLGRLAEALDEFVGAEAQAHTEDARDVLRLVGPAIEALRPRVPRLTVRVRPADATAAVAVDGVEWPADQLGAPRTVDPGEHQLDATAPDGRAAHQRVTLHEGEAVTVDLTLPAPPPAVGAPAPAPARRSEPVVHAAPRSERPAARGGSLGAAIATTATAAALGGFGVFAFFEAGARHDDGRRDCAATPSQDACDSLKPPVRAWDWTAAAAWASAGIAGGVAIALWARSAARSEPEPTPSALLVVRPDAVLLRGSF